MSDLRGKSILITGGTGSFGNAFTEELLASHDPDRVIILSRDEKKQWDMARKFDDERLRFFLGDVRDLPRLTLACRNVDVIVSAAALKQVPALEYNPMEAVATNIIGAAQNVVMAALENNVPRVLYVSSDKSVAPLNSYGVSKAMGERLIVAANAYSGGSLPMFSAVRYGNVAGSRGSVIPLWRESLTKGEPLVATDGAATRFWMRIEHAVQFVIQVLARMRGGEIFVPRLPSFYVADLANVLADQWWWYEAGLRPGEKMHETLISADEARLTQAVKGLGYVITRQPSALISDTAPKDGELVGEGFTYSSDGNNEWLNREGLAKELENV